MTNRTRATDTYVADLIEVLRPHARGLPRQNILSELEESRKRRDLPIPTKFEQAVQSVFNQHCVESEVFRDRNLPEDGFFHSAREGNIAIWSVDVQRADAWLCTRLPYYELAHAIARIKGVSIDKALAAVEQADEDTRRNWRTNAKVKYAIAQNRADRAMEAVRREEGNEYL